MDAETPFREQDLDAQIAALQRDCAALRLERARLVRDIADRRPWSWKRFGLGLIVGILPVLILSILVGVALELRR
jgi:hypothetical protein